MKRHLFLVSAMIVCSAISGSVLAKKPHKEQVEAASSDRGAADSSRDEPWLKVTISESEATVVRRYFTAHPPAALPPGLQKNVARGKRLPPGWQKKLARGKVLDADLYRSAEPLPAVVIRELPPQPRGTVLIRLEGKVVRLVQATREIIDILEL